MVEEDRETVASLQQSMKSPGQRPGPMSKSELGIQHVINDVLHRVYENDDPLSSGEAAALGRHWRAERGAC